MVAAGIAEGHDEVTSSPLAAYAALAATSLAAAGIHFAVMGEHFQEYVPFGVFFSVVAWLQALWAVGLVLSPSRWLLAAGLVGNLAVVAVWVVSRTAGLPLGPEPGAAEAASFVDVLSTLLEVLIVLGCAALLARPRTPAFLRQRAGWVAVAAIVLVLAPLTSAAIASSAGEHGAEEKGHEELAGDAAEQPGLVRADLGNGNLLQVLIDSPEGGPAQIHLTFFDPTGNALEVASVALQGTAPSGEVVDIPTSEFETGHYAATTDMEPGPWSFEVRAVTRDSEELATTFEADVG